MTVHKIDPEADTVVTLTNPPNRLAWWPTQEEHKDSAQEQEANGQIDDQVDSETEIWYRVASRHLLLVSSWFKRVLGKIGQKQLVMSPMDVSVSRHRTGLQMHL